MNAKYPPMIVLTQQELEDVIGPVPEWGDSGGVPYLTIEPEIDENPSEDAMFVCGNELIH